MHRFDLKIRYIFFSQYKVWCWAFGVPQGWCLWAVALTSEVETPVITSHLHLSHPDKCTLPLSLPQKQNIFIRLASFFWYRKCLLILHPFLSLIQNILLVSILPLMKKKKRKEKSRFSWESQHCVCWRSGTNQRQSIYKHSVDQIHFDQHKIITEEMLWYHT